MIRRIFCWFSRCLRCTTQADEIGIWGECIDCHKKHGYVTREEIRRWTKTGEYTFRVGRTPPRSS